jgi:hypothetical protein
VNAPGKSPSPKRVVITAGALVMLAFAVTPVCAAPARPKGDSVKKVDPPRPARIPATSGGAGGPRSLEWAITSALRP